MMTRSVSNPDSGALAVSGNVAQVPCVISLLIEGAVTVQQADDLPRETAAGRERSLRHVQNESVLLTHDRSPTTRLELSAR